MVPLWVPLSGSGAVVALIKCLAVFCHVVCCTRVACRVPPAMLVNHAIVTSDEHGVAHCLLQGYEGYSCPFVGLGSQSHTSLSRPLQRREAVNTRTMSSAAKDNAQTGIHPSKHCASAPAAAHGLACRGVCAAETLRRRGRRARSSQILMNVCLRSWS